MRLDTIDDREPVAVNVRLKAATYDLAQRYKEYAAMNGQVFKTDGQLVAAIVDAFVKRGDKDFLTWLRAQQKPAAKAEKQPPPKVNGINASSPA